jgi:hypothetical protein
LAKAELGKAHAPAVAAGQITQEQADRMQKRLEASGGFGGPSLGRGAGKTSLLMTVAAEKLGMTGEDGL